MNIETSHFELSVSASRRNGLNKTSEADRAARWGRQRFLAEMNNGLSTERAIRGVFSTSSYITVGDAYAKKGVKDDRERGLQMSADFPKSGIAGALPNSALFDREHKWLFGGEKYAICLPHAVRSTAWPLVFSQRETWLVCDPSTGKSNHLRWAYLMRRSFTFICVIPCCRYVDRTMYLKTQPPESRKKGFGSSDAKRRDEFSNDIEVRS